MRAAHHETSPTNQTSALPLRNAWNREREQWQFTRIRCSSKSMCYLKFPTKTPDTEGNKALTQKTKQRLTWPIQFILAQQLSNMFKLIAILPHLTYQGPALQSTPSHAHFSYTWVQWEAGCQLFSQQSWVMLSVLNLCATERLWQLNASHIAVSIHVNLVKEIPHIFQKGIDLCKFRLTLGQLQPVILEAHQPPSQPCRYLLPHWDFG